MPNLSYELVTDFDDYIQAKQSSAPATVDEAIKQIMVLEKIQEPLTGEFLRVCITNAKLFDCKQSDYGSGNISEFGDFGCIVRMSDKLKRLANLYGKRKKMRVRESVMDNLRDIGNYAIISIMWLTGKWPK